MGSALRRPFLLFLSLLAAAAAFVLWQRAQYMPLAKAERINDTSSCVVSRWKIRPELYPETDQAQGIAFITDSMGLKPLLSDSEAVVNMAGFLIRRFHAQLGDPGNMPSGLSPWSLFGKIQEGHELQCTQYSALFAFFCRLHGLICREIEVWGRNDRHMVNEVFLRESRQWVYVDLTHGLCMVRRNGQLLSLSALLHGLNKEGDTSSLEMLAGANPVVWSPAVSMLPALHRSFDSSCVLHYYLFPDLNIQREPWYRWQTTMALRYSLQPPREPWAGLSVGFSLLYLLLVFAAFRRREKV